MQRLAMPAKTDKKALDVVLERWIELKNRSEFELVGMILARAQLLEEMMKVQIVDRSKRYNGPRDVKGTFGPIKSQIQRSLS